MEQVKHDRFYYANQTLQGYLHRMEGIIRGTCPISEIDLSTIQRRLSNSSFSVGESSRGETLDADLQNEIGEYVTNLNAVQNALESLRKVMPSRRTRLQNKNPTRTGLLGFAGTSHQPQ